MGKEITIVKNRIHIILTRIGKSVSGTDGFGKRILRIIKTKSSILGNMGKITLANMVERIKDLKDLAT